MTFPPVPTPPSWLTVASQVGVPAAVLYFVLSQLVPRIDRGIQIADRVDATLVLVSAQLARCGS